MNKFLLVAVLFALLSAVLGNSDWEGKNFIIRMDKYAQLHDREALVAQVTEFLEKAGRLTEKVVIKKINDDAGVSYPTIIAPVHPDDTTLLVSMAGVKEVLPDFEWEDEGPL